MLIYCICTQYLVGAPFALIRRGMEVISLWHCWGGMEAQVSLTVALSSSAFFGLLFLIFLLTIPHRFSIGFRSGEFAGQSSTPRPWSFNQLLVLLAVWAGAKSCWKMKSASFKSWSAEGSAPTFLGKRVQWRWFSKNVHYNLLRVNWWIFVKCEPKSSQLILLTKLTKDLNYLSLCALNLFNTQVSHFELNYWNKSTFPRHCNLLRCTCMSILVED